MTTLITGATGHIGNVLTRLLCLKGRRVRALVLPGEDCRPIEDLDVEKISGDITQPETISDAFKDVDTVFHLAGAISIMPGKNPQLWRINVQGTRNAINAAMQAGVQRFVYASSIHAIHRTHKGTIIDETLPFDPNNPYGEYDRTKAQASLEVLKAIEEGLNAVIVLPTGVIGPYDFRRSEIGQIILDYLDEKPQFFVNGAYDFVDVRDVAEGFIQAAQFGQTGESYILSGEQLTIQEFFKILQQVTQKRVSTFHVPITLARFAAFFTPLYYHLTDKKPKFTPYSLEVLGSNSTISYSKAYDQFNYNPRRLQDTIRDTVSWFKENRSRLYPSYLR